MTAFTTVLIRADYTNVVDEGGFAYDVPDLGSLVPYIAPASGRTFAACWKTGAVWHHFFIVELDTLVGGERWFAGCGTPNIAGALAAHGVTGDRVHVNPPPPLREQFVAAGCRALRRKSDDALIGVASPLDLAGLDTVTIALAGAGGGDANAYSVVDE